MQPAKWLSLLNEALYLIFLTSLVCSFRAVCSISIAVIIVAGLVKNKLETKSFFHQNLRHPFFISCILLFVIHIIALAWTQNSKQGWTNIVLTSGLLFTPLAVSCTNYINTVTREKILSRYCLMLALACLYCLCRACVHYFQSGDDSHFFYHALVSPFDHHAVYFSILVFIALVFLTEGLVKNSLFFRRPVYIVLVIFLSLFLFLLSSKLVIIFYGLYLVYLFILLIKKRKGSRVLMISSFLVLVVIGSLTLFIRNPISNRFYDLFNGNISIIKQEKFDPGNYFNGLQFRLLQWKFTGEILNETNRWWYGVSPGDAQALIDQKYISTKMYTGNPEKGTKGFLGYNTHNEFLETLLQSGIPGLIILLAICVSMLKIARQKRRRALTAVILLLLAWLFTESVFERQFGIMIFTFFPLFLSFD